MAHSIIAEIREIVKTHARLTGDVDGLSDSADLYNAGLTSHASVNLMLALENKFDLEFPDRMLRKRVFESIESIASAIKELQSEGA